jgi:hypothetical protein
MPTTRLLITVSERQKTMLDCLRKDGYTASAYIRMMLDNDLEAWTGMAINDPAGASRQRRHLTEWALATQPETLAQAKRRKGR